MFRINNDDLADEQVIDDCCVGRLSEHVLTLAQTACRKTVGVCVCGISENEGVIFASLLTYSS